LIFRPDDGRISFAIHLIQRSDVHEPMKFDLEAYQTHWHPKELREGFSNTPDTSFVFHAWDWRVERSASAGQPGRLLDVACGNARDIVALSELGWEAWGLDASPLQLRDAGKAAEETGRRINLVRGVAEWLPFKEGVFDSLICKSALYHFADPEKATREIARALHPKGRAVASVVQFSSLSSRSSRVLYWLLRVVWWPARRKHFFWDNPISSEQRCVYTLHSFRALGEPYFSEADCYGVSLLWGFPGWGRFLSFLPDSINDIMLRALNKLAQRLPRLADVVVLVWQPKESGDQNSVD
jgi:SAM-dependent methyltransferase